MADCITAFSRGLPRAMCTFLCPGGDLKVLDGEVLDAAHGLVGLPLPISILLPQGRHPARAQVVRLHGDLKQGVVGLGQGCASLGPGELHGVSWFFFSPENQHPIRRK